MKNKLNNKKRGFTLVELLVVISIMSILTIISVASFVNAQTKARDSQRKSDLDGLSKALMMYYNDYGIFPATVNFGNSSTGFTGSGGIIYMRKIPIEIRAGWLPYVYLTNSSGTTFNLFANLENKKDSQCKLPPYSNNYCYGVASPNTIVDPAQF